MKTIKAYALALKIKSSTFIESGEIYLLKREAVDRAISIEARTSYSVIPVTITYNEKEL